MEAPVGGDAVVASFVFKGSDFVQRILALRLQLIQLLFPATDSIPAVVQGFIERLAFESGLQFGNRFIERRYLGLQLCDLIVIPLAHLLCFWSCRSRGRSIGARLRGGRRIVQGGGVHRDCRSSRLSSGGACGCGFDSVVRSVGAGAGTRGALRANRRRRAQYESEAKANTINENRAKNGVHPDDAPCKAARLITIRRLRT